MSASNIAFLPQHKTALVVADTAAYGDDGRVTLFRSKIHAVDRWPGVISGCGNLLAGSTLKSMIADAFDSFDDMVARIEIKLPALVNDATAELSAIVGEAIELHHEFFLVGWSKARSAIEVYGIGISDALPLDQTAEQVAELKAAGKAVDAFKLRRISDDRAEVFNTPILPFHLTLDTSFTPISDEDSVEHAAKVLRLYIEAQRYYVSSQGTHLVGGWADIATITPHGVKMDILCQWPEDCLEHTIQPAAIDWDAFRASIGLPPGMSFEERKSIADEMARLQRQLAELVPKPARPKLRLVDSH